MSCVVGERELLSCVISNSKMLDMRYRGRRIHRMRQKEPKSLTMRHKKPGTLLSFVAGDGEYLACVITSLELLLFTRKLETPCHALQVMENTERAS